MTDFSDEQQKAMMQFAHQLDTVPGFADWFSGEKGRAFVAKLAEQGKPGALLLAQMMAPSETDYSEARDKFMQAMKNPDDKNLQIWAKEECVHFWLAAMEAEDNLDQERADKMFAIVPEEWKREIASEARDRRRHAKPY